MADRHSHTSNMARPSWVVDPSRFASKIKSASSDPSDINWKSNPAILCPKCQHTIDNSDAAQLWPGLPKGVKFDPSDQEIVEHLLAKVGQMDLKPHPFIDEFITTLDREDGICYTHPQNLPGVKKDGTASHFFHRAIKAYNTGTRKRRKIQGEDFGDLRWHKTGRTKPVIVDGVQRGCKKIMVLYVSLAKGGKSEKTNWVIHQYHLGTGEDEKNGEYVISKIFYQQQPLKQGEKSVQDYPDDNTVTEMAVKGDPVTPKSMTPDPPRIEKRLSNFSTGQGTGAHEQPAFVETEVVQPEHEVETEVVQHQHEAETEIVQPEHKNSTFNNEAIENNYADEMVEDNEIHVEGASKWWEGESQDLLDSQQLVEGLSLCDEFLRSQSPDRDGNVNDGASKGRPCLSDYARLGKEHLKRDLEECQNLAIDPANIELDTPPDFRLSQLEFASQDSYIPWGGEKVID